MKPRGGALDSPSSVSLREITAETVRAVVGLSVADHQTGFVAPNAVAGLPPALAVSGIAIRLEIAIAPQPVSHSWHGRAPPHI